MLGSLYSGITGMDAASKSMEVIGNNIANVNTCAFKAGTISFASVYSDTITIPGGEIGNEQGKGVQVVGLNSVWEQGNLDTTMNPTDVCISGDGFFRVVENGTNIYYTRAGQFEFDENSYLVDPEGFRVQGFDFADNTDPASIDTTANFDIWIPTGYTDVLIETDGIITAVNSLGNKEYLSQISVYNFANNEGLRKVTGNLYEESVNSGQPLSLTGNVSGANGAGKVKNGLEMSNVDLAREFVDLIVSQRAFQANSRVISSSADMLQEVINIIR